MPVIDPNDEQYDDRDFTAGQVSPGRGVFVAVGLYDKRPRDPQFMVSFTCVKSLDGQEGNVGKDMECVYNLQTGVRFLALALRAAEAGPTDTDDAQAVLDALTQGLIEIDVSPNDYKDKKGKDRKGLRAVSTTKWSGTADEIPNLQEIAEAGSQRHEEKAQRMKDAAAKPKTNYGGGGGGRPSGGAGGRTSPGPSEDIPF